MKRAWGWWFVCLMGAAICLAGGAWAAETQPMPGAKRYLPSPPEELTLCGQPVPLKLPFVAEQLDREFTIMVHDQAQVVMWLKRARRFFPYISQELAKAGLPEDLKYLAVAESSLLHRIRSRAGAVGVWQFIPATARRYGMKVDRYLDQRRDVEKATAGAIAYLKDLHQEFGSWPLAMAAYNCGEKRVRNELAEQGVKDYYNLYLPYETMRYVFRIMGAKIIISDPQRYGYDLPDGRLYQPVEADRVTLQLRRPLHLRELAQATGTNLRALKELNPELRNYYLPPGPMEVKVPKGQGADLEKRLAQVVKQAGGRPVQMTARGEELDDEVYVVREGDNLGKIARRFRKRITDLRRANALESDRLHPGQKLVIPVD